MISTPGERRHAMQFALALEAGAASEPAIAPLVRIAEALRADPGLVPAPSREFRDSLRALLVEAAATAPVPVRPARGRHALPGRLEIPHPWRRRIVAAGAGLALAAGGAGGIAAASTSALPGDTLYGVKRSVEGMQLSLAGSATGEGNRYLSLADTRLDEVEAVLSDEGPRPSRPAVIRTLRSTLSDMRNATIEGRALLISAYRESRDRDALRSLTAFADRERTRLVALKPALPPQVHRQSAALLSLMMSIDREATLLGSAGHGPASGEAPLGGGQPGPGGVATTPGESPTSSQPGPRTPSESSSPSRSHTPDRSGDGLPLPDVSVPGGPLPSGDSGPRSPGAISAGVTLPPLLSRLDSSFDVELRPLLPGVPVIRAWVNGDS
ncbi:MAG: DUF5667 domain-containing protein [Carbonactinosporaceae bacterium]